MTNDCVSDTKLKWKSKDVWLLRQQVNWQNITVNTVVPNCCKGDKPSQWEYPIFGPL